MDPLHPYRASTPPPEAPVVRRRWSEVDAEIVIACVSAALVVASSGGSHDQRGLTLGLLGLLGASASIIAWLRRPKHESPVLGTVRRDVRAARESNEAPRA